LFKEVESFVVYVYVHVFAVVFTVASLNCVHFNTS